ncbi:PHP domain-containing protein [uncultured Ilyobacter sp.]|uniref:PHP domain-containing protein n=1 Tax=uncultured Ilyobacter sp. TaxID=544433 RepID=UPI0029BFD4B4|nr:PHP domain-containing protein [uncultured Ilyobacter sp.]
MDLIRLELHTHTKYSHDSLLGKYGYLTMLKLKKINVVAITDHNEIEGALNFKKFLEEFGIRVIVGEEIFSTKGEIVGLFLNQRIKPGLTPNETMNEIKNQGGLVYIPHPYDEKRYKTVLCEEEIIKNENLIDIIEIHNGRNIKNEFSKKQFEICKRYNKVPAIGSDAHTILELGRNYNIVGNFDGPNEFIESLKNAEHIIKKCWGISHNITKLDRLIKLLLRGEKNEIYRIIYGKFKRKITGTSKKYRKNL